MSRDFNDVLREEGIEAAVRLDASAIKYEPPAEADGGDDKVFQFKPRETKLRQQKEPETASVPFSEDALALQFASANTNVRFVDEMGEWLLFDGKLGGVARA